MTKKILEEFSGFVDKIDEDIAYVTLKNNNETLYGELDINEFEVRERRRFSFKAIQDNDNIIIEIKDIPDNELTQERIDEIESEIESLGDDLSQNDY